MSPNSLKTLVRIRGDHLMTRSVVRFREDRHQDDGGSFLICDPVGAFRITHSGDVVSSYADFVVLGAILICAFLAAIDATTLDDGIPLSIMGATGGLVIGAIIERGVTAVAKFIHRKLDQGRGRDISFKITKDNPQAWRLCATVAKLAEVESWVNSTVDPARRVPSILWLAVGRSIAIDRRYADAIKALEYPSLEDIANMTFTKIDRERQSLNVIEANLNQVLATSIGIDHLVAEKKLAERRQQEERALRGRLASYDKIAEPQVSDTQADRSVGLAAETEVIANLLVESDRMLRESI